MSLVRVFWGSGGPQPLRISWSLAMAEFFSVSLCLYGEGCLKLVGVGEHVSTLCGFQWSFVVHKMRQSTIDHFGKHTLACAHITLLLPWPAVMSLPSTYL